MDRKAILGLIRTLATDRELARAFATVLADADRPQRPPEGAPVFPAPIIPSVTVTSAGIAKGRSRLAALRRELEQIHARQRAHADTASDEHRISQINLEAEIIRKGIDMATRFLGPGNGGNNAA
jgi:hypothetical protein